VLAAACGARPGLELVSWREGREIRDSIEVALPERYASVPIAADGFFTIRDAQGRTHYFAEADCGSMSIKRFTLKLKAFAAYYRQRRHVERFGIRHFRVLTVATSRVRCKNLMDAAAAAEDVRKDGRLFLFAAVESLPLAEPGNIFARIWTVPGREEPCSLL